MATNKQIRANRENALRSTGPKSRSGIRRTSMNALKHGLSAKKIIVRNESPEDFNKLYRNFVKDLTPIDAIQMELVGQITMETWRLRRIRQIEADIYQSETPVDEINIHDRNIRDLSDGALTRLMQRTSTSGIDSEDFVSSPRLDQFGLLNRLNQLGQYQANIERSLYRALQALEHLQEKHSNMRAAILVETKTV